MQSIAAIDCIKVKKICCDFYVVQHVFRLTKNIRPAQKTSNTLKYKTKRNQKYLNIQH